MQRSPMKTCSKCRIAKDILCFSVQRDKKDGLCSQCRECRKEQAALKKTERSERDSLYRKRNAEAIRLKDRARYARDREKILEQKRIYTARITDEKRVYNAEYREKNKEAIAKKQKEYHAKNRQHRIERHREYVGQNKTKIQKQNQEWKNAKYANDELYAFQYRIKNLVKAAFRNKGYTRKSRIQAILGCTYAEFISHIEGLFVEGMSWANRCDWHIDHIVPLASAKTESDLLALNHHTNLRPLWAADNLCKGAKMPEHLAHERLI